MLRVTFEHGVAFAQPGPARIKLFKEPADRYLPKRLDIGYWNPLGAKMIFAPDDLHSSTGPQRLSALYYLEVPSSSVDLDRPFLEQLYGIDLFKTICPQAWTSDCSRLQDLNASFVLPSELRRKCRFFD